MVLDGRAAGCRDTIDSGACVGCVFESFHLFTHHFRVTQFVHSFNNHFRSHSFSLAMCGVYTQYRSAPAVSREQRASRARRRASEASCRRSRGRACVGSGKARARAMFLRCAPAAFWRRRARSLRRPNAVSFETAQIINLFSSLADLTGSGQTAPTPRRRRRACGGRGRGRGGRTSCRTRRRSRRPRRRRSRRTRRGAGGGGAS